jgi:hypothetical protein
VQALQKRFTLLAPSVASGVFSARRGPAASRCISRRRCFTAVALEDHTPIGGLASGVVSSQAGQAELKLWVRLDALTGQLPLGEPSPARSSDRPLHRRLLPLPSGCPRLVDLGFFELKRMARDSAHGRVWISRVPARLSVRDGDGPARPIAAWLERQGCDRIDTLVTRGSRSP